VILPDANVLLHAEDAASPLKFLAPKKSAHTMVSGATMASTGRRANPAAQADYQRGAR